MRLREADGDHQHAVAVGNKDVIQQLTTDSRLNRGYIIEEPKRANENHPRSRSSFSDE